MRNIPIAERIVNVLAACSLDPSLWPIETTADCELIYARYEALRLEIGAKDAWRQSRLEWVRNAIKRSGLVRVAYHFRDCPQTSV